MHKFLLLWILWLLLLRFATLAQTGGKLESGMILVFDAMDTSLWEVQADSLDLSLLVDFDAPEASISPFSFRLDRQSIIYLRVPIRGSGGLLSFELIEHDMHTGIESSIIQAERMFVRFIPSADAVLLEMDEGEERSYCVLFFVTTECRAASQDLVEFLTNRDIVWQNDEGYVLTDEALYHFDLESLTWESLLENAWLVARSAAFDSTSNTLYIAGNLGEVQSLCNPNQLLRVDLQSLSVSVAPYSLPTCISNYSKMLVSPDGRYLQYNARELIVIELETGEIAYRPFLYSIRSSWLADSQRMVVNNAEEFGSNINEISVLDMRTGEIARIYEGRAGYVWLYEVP